MDENDAIRDQFQAYVDERKEADVELAKSVSAIEVRDRTVTVTLDPDAAGITAETALAGYDEDFVSRFFALPAIGPGGRPDRLERATRPCGGLPRGRIPRGVCRGHRPAARTAGLSCVPWTKRRSQSSDDDGGSAGARATPNQRREASALHRRPRRHVREPVPASHDRLTRRSRAGRR